MNIRPALLSDARAIAELHVLSWQSQSGIIGWIGFGASRDADATASVGEIEAIYVSPAHWSAGTGRSLWSIARARLRERKLTSVTLWVLEENFRAIRFYLTAGFAPDAASRKQITLGGKNLWEMRYAQRLDEPEREGDK